MAAAPLEDPLVLDFLWPTGGNNGRTYERHLQYLDLAPKPLFNIDINQDIERSDLAGGVLDRDKFDEADAGAAAFAAHDGIALVHTLGSDEDKIFGYSVEIVVYDQRGYDSQSSLANRLYSTFYGHLREVFIASGEPVTLGQLIGRVGGSGKGRIDEYLPHIHFEFQNSAGEATSVNSPVRLPGDLGELEPVRFYKGMLQTSGMNRLSSSTILYGPASSDYDVRSSVVLAATRPNERLPVNMKGFDWAEDVSIRIVNVGGAEAFPYRGLDSEISSTVRTSSANDDDIFEETAGASGKPDLAPLFEIPGLYYLQALERNRDVGWGTAVDRDGVIHGDEVPPGEMRTAQFGTWNQRVSWAQNDWASAPGGYPRGPDADAINLAVVVSPFAPPIGIEEVIERDRRDGVLWRILSDSTLVITGTSASDEIKIARHTGGAEWMLNINGQHFQMASGSFSSVFVDGGAGDDTISLDELPPTIGASVFGGDGDDFIHGGAAIDFLIGGSGADVILGGPGEDWILGNDGDDVLAGHSTTELVSSAVDHVFGESGFDVLQVDDNDDASGGTAVGWQHPVERFDVNNDGQIVALDVLAVINEINAPKHCTSSGQLPVGRPLDAFYYDSNGDGLCTAVGDVLPLVNFLNARSAAEAESERGMLSTMQQSGNGVPTGWSWPAAASAARDDGSDRTTAPTSDESESNTTRTEQEVWTVRPVAAEITREDEERRSSFDRRLTATEIGMGSKRISETDLCF